MYSYAQVENALMLILGLEETQRGSLRGQLKHFQTLGISPPSARKGKRIRYEKLDAFKWALCSELSEFGIDPKIIAKIFIVLWNFIAPDIHDMKWGYHIMFYPALRRADSVNDYDKIRSMLKPMCFNSMSELTTFAMREVEVDDLYDRRFAVIHIGGLWLRLAAALDGIA